MHECLADLPLPPLLLVDVVVISIEQSLRLGHHQHLPLILQLCQFHFILRLLIVGKRLIEVVYVLLWDEWRDKGLVQQRQMS